MANTTHISDQWQRTKHIVADALELPHAQRDAFVTETCAHDAILKAEVLDLLRSFDTAGDMLSEQGVPAQTLAAALGSPNVSGGTRIGRYEVRSLLGTGGMGSVFEAFDTSLQRPVALKLLSMGLASTGARRRFDAEAAALARLDHPGVARVFEIGVYDPAAPGPVGKALSVPFFAMELVHGAKTIDKYCRDAHTSVRDTLTLFAHVCDAIHHGHQKSVLHRDIKPRNILVDAQGNPKVIDFGVSRLLDASAQHVTQAHDIVGTPAYMPPEAFEKGVHALDTRADVYSLGITLYELLQGEPAFDVARLTPSQASKAIAEKPLPRLGSRNKECEGDIETIVAKAIARDPADRYQSVDQFAADIRRVLAYEPILARRASLWKQTRLFAKRHRALVFAGLAVVAGITAGIAGLAIGLARAKESAAIAQLEATRATRVSDFMLNMIRSGSPTNPSTDTRLSLDFSAPMMSRWPSAAPEGNAPTVGDLLYTASDQVESSFPDDPVLQAQIASMLAQTSGDLSDKRSVAVVERAERILERTYGPDDTRTMIARSMRYNAIVLSGNHSAEPDMERDIRYIISRNRSDDLPLLTSLCAMFASSSEWRGSPRDALPLLREVRSSLGTFSHSDDEYKISLDRMMLRANASVDNFSQTLAALQECLDRANHLTTGGRRARINVVFELMTMYRGRGDFQTAQALAADGLAESTAAYGNQSHAAYEWLSNLYAISMALNDAETTMYAARTQLDVSLRLLGPSSRYTSKAYGRVARSLLEYGQNPSEAQRDARSAVDLLSSDLDIGDGWALYHELLWAWAIREQGDPQRAKEVMLDRMDIESREGRSQAVAWVEVIRWTQLAECEMDIAADNPDYPLNEAARCVREATCYADMLGYDWPSSKFAYRAHDRLDVLAASRAK